MLATSITASVAVVEGSTDRKRIDRVVARRFRSTALTGRVRILWGSTCDGRHGRVGKKLLPFMLSGPLPVGKTDVS